LILACISATEKLIQTSPSLLNNILHLIQFIIEVHVVDSSFPIRVKYAKIEAWKDN